MMAIGNLNVCFYIVALAVGFAAAKDEYTESGEFYRTYSQLTEVPTDIPDEAKEVYLYGNQMTQLQRGSFSRLQNCTKVDVGTNTIVTIETGAFQGLSNVKKVNLYMNRLQEIGGGMWKGLLSLRTLILSSNNIRSLAPGSFLGLVRLEYLSLWSNDIHEIRGDMLNGLVSLKTLLLGENKLNIITPGAFVNLPSLQALKLQDNGLTTIPEEALVDPDCPDEHPNNVMLGITLNPIECDSRLCWLKQAEAAGWIQLSNIWHNPPRCANNPGTPWENVNLGCPSSH